MDKIIDEKFQPTQIKKIGGSQLKIVWSDGHKSEYSFRYLRQNCRCAVCIDEWTGNQILAKDQVPESLEGIKVSVVGQYALGFDFSDGHSAGIYTFKHLREICSCGSCKK